MKESFVTGWVTPKRLIQIEMINEILEEYSEQHYSLTLRQLYYQLVARGKIENTIPEYKKVMKSLKFGRLEGLIDWEMIEDRSRPVTRWYFERSVSDALSSVAYSYALERQMGQPYNIEIWTEKDAVSNILKRVCRPKHLKLLINKGYSSATAMYDTYKRIKHEKRKTIILYVGDHDPSGLDMVRDIKDRLEQFKLTENENFEIVHVALTMKQIREFDPPPNPAKITDTRAQEYISEHGEFSWELDALEPKVLEEVVEAEAKKYLDIKIFNAVLEREQSEKNQIKDFIKTFGKSEDEDDDDDGFRY